MVKSVFCWGDSYNPLHGMAGVLAHISQGIVTILHELLSHHTICEVAISSKHNKVA